MSNRPIAFLLCLLAAPLMAQQLTFAEGTITNLQIVALPESNPLAAGTTLLQNVEFVPIEQTGRTIAHEADASRARRIERHGLQRIELPGGGRLFCYKRNGGQYWGLLHIAASGAGQVVLELAGVGPGLLDPFADRIGVHADGLHAVVPLVAGGAHFVRLDGGVYGSTGRADRFVMPAALPLIPTSVMVGATVAFFQTADARLWRCGIADGLQPVDVSPPPVPNGEWKDQMVLSRDGSRLVFLYGPRDQQRLFAIGTTGPASLLPPPPSKYEEPGYLPEDPGEPAMLLSDDGTRLFFVDSIVRDELHLLDLTGSLPALQITANAIFQPYIGMHILPRFLGAALLVAIGDPGQMDWFRASLNAPGGTVVNLTGTGSLQQPFPSGQIDPVQAIDTGGPWLIAEQQLAAMALRRLDPVTGANTIVQQDLLAVPQMGSATTGTADLLVQGSSGERIYRGGTANLFPPTPAGVLLTPPVSGPLLSATWVHLASDWGIVALYLPNGALLTGSIEHGVRQLAMTEAGGVVLVGTPLRYLAPGVFAVLNRPAVPVRWCLSGAGG